MRYLLLSVVALLMFSCHGHKETTSSDNASLKEIRFVNSGDILSTYDLAGDDNAVKAIRKATGGDEAKMKEVYKYANEDSWPEGMDNFEERLANKPTIMAFKAYLFCSFPHKDRGTLNVLKIPASENKKQPKGFELTHDIYFVILSSGFEVK